MVRPNIIVLIPGPKLLFPSHVQHFCALSKPKPKPKPLPNVNCAAFPTSYLFNVLHFFKRLIFSWVFSFRNSISQKWLLARDFFSPATLLFLFLLAVWRFLLAIWLYLLAIWLFLAMWRFLSSRRFLSSTVPFNAMYRFRYCFFFFIFVFNPIFWIL